MSKIKAKDGYSLRQMKSTGRVHIYTNDSVVCGCLSYANECDPPIDSCDFDDLCGNCRNHEDAYEEIPQHIAEMPEGYRIMEVGETITEDSMIWWDNSEEWRTSTIAGARVRLGTLCCPVDADRGEPVTDNSMTLKNALERIADLEKQVAELNAANDELNEDGAKQVQLIAELEKERDELRRDYETAQEDAHLYLDQRGEARQERDELRIKAKEFGKKYLSCKRERDELKRKLDASAEASTHERTTINLLTEKLEKAEAERDDYRSQIVQIEKAHDALCDATKGYTLENITTFMEAMPKPEELDGYVIECIGQDRGINQFELLFRVQPIIEYIPTEDLDDRLISAQLTCEYGDQRYQNKNGKLIAMVHDDLGHPFVILTARGSVARYSHCRIRKDTIERLRAAK